MTCTHTYGVLNSQGEPVKIRYTRMFCPDCGERLEAPGPTKCTHYGSDSGGADYYGTSNPPQEADWNYAYCPNCGKAI